MGGEKTVKAHPEENLLIFFPGVLKMYFPVWVCLILQIVKSCM